MTSGLQNNCVPLFVEIDIEALNINVELNEAAVKENTRAFMIAHMLGKHFDISCFFIKIEYLNTFEEHNLDGVFESAIMESINNISITNIKRLILITNL